MLNRHSEIHFVMGISVCGRVFVIYDDGYAGKGPEASHRSEKLPRPAS